MINKRDIYIVIPAKDEAPRLGDVLEQLIELEYDNIVIVDDGSTDDTMIVAKKYGVTVVRHRVNLGAGAATQTGIHWALRRGAKYVVSMDGDTQHDGRYIEQMVAELVSGNYDLVIGSRFLKKNEAIPFTRKIYNRIANVVTWMLTGIYVTDSQSGMRAMRNTFARRSELHWSGFEFCIEQLRHAKRLHARIKEVPIDVKYSRETMRKGQNFITGIKMLGTIVRRHTHL